MECGCINIPPPSSPLTFAFSVQKNDEYVVPQCLNSITEVVEWRLGDTLKALEAYSVFFDEGLEKGLNSQDGEMLDVRYSITMAVYIFLQV